MKTQRMPTVTSRIFCQPVLDSKPILLPFSDEIQIRVYAVAINPADTEFIPLFLLRKVCGLQYAGIVEAIGNEVKNFNVGDRVGGPALGGIDVRTAAFAEFVCAPAHTAFLIPDSIYMTQAVSLSIGLVTSILSLR